MNFLKRQNKNVPDAATSGERRRFIAPLIATGLASAGLFLTGCSEPQENAPSKSHGTHETTSTVERINYQAIENIQNQAKERWPSTTCAYAFAKDGTLNIDIVNEGLEAAVQELAHQGNEMVVPHEIAGLPITSTFVLSEKQKEVITSSAQNIARNEGQIEDPENSIAVCLISQGSVLLTQDAYVVVARTKQERSDR